MNQHHQIPNENNIKQFYNNRKKLNKQICGLLGKDAYLHEISNSDSSSCQFMQHDNELVRNFERISEVKTAQFNDYYHQINKNSIKQKKVGKKSHIANNQYLLPHENSRYSNSFSSHDNKITQNNNHSPKFTQNNTNNQKIKLWDQTKQLIIQKLQNIQNKQTLSILRQLTDEQLLIHFMKQVTQTIDQLKQDRANKVQKSETIKSTSRLKYSSKSFIDGSQSKMDSFLNYQIDELKEKFEMLETQNQQSLGKIMEKDNKIKQLQIKLLDNNKSQKNEQGQQGEIDLLKKISQVRLSQIEDLRNKSRNVEVQNQKLLEFSQKLKKIVFFAKKMNDNFIDKYEEQIKEARNQLLTQTNMRKLKDKLDISNLKIEYRNSRFGIVRGRSLQKNFQFNHRANE